MDKVVFEPQSNHNIIGKISCYPNYDLLGSAQGMKVLVGGAVVENTDGVIYAKLLDRWGRRESIPGRHAFSQWYHNMTLEFYSDQAGIIPYSVSNLPYKIKMKRYDHIRDTIPTYYVPNPAADTVVSGIANGTSFLHGEVLIEYASDWRNRPFLEVNGIEFTNLGSYEWYNSNWNVISE